MPDAPSKPSRLALEQAAKKVLAELATLMPRLMRRELWVLQQPDDLAQVVAHEFWKAIDRFEQRTPDLEQDVRALMMTIAGCRITDVARLAERAADRIEGEVLEGVRARGHDASRKAGRELALTFMLQCLPRLAPQALSIIRLYDIENKSYRQVGETLGISEDQARRARVSALDQIRDMMGGSSHFSFGSGQVP